MTAALGFVLLILSMVAARPSGAVFLRGDTPTALPPRAFLPLVLRDWSPRVDCPTTSTNSYSSGVAYQYDQDNPVRPARYHADKNLALRGYTLNTNPSLRHSLVDYGSDDPTMPPQMATLFDPPRVPELGGLYRVYNWNWAQSPDPGSRGDPISWPPVTALGLRTTPGEALRVPESGYSIGGNPPMEVLVLFADEDSIALRYTREDSSGSQGYTLHVDAICVDPNLLALYRQLDDPNGPRYVYPNPQYNLVNLPAGYPFGWARGVEIVVAISDTGVFQDPRSCNEWWQIRPGYGVCPPHE